MAALIITAAFFGIWHRNLGQFIYTFMFALAVGTVYERSGSLKYTMLIHFCINFFTVLAYSENRNGVFGKLHVFPALKRLFMDAHPVLGAVYFIVLVGMIVLLLMIFFGIWKEETAQQKGV